MIAQALAGPTSPCAAHPNARIWGIFGKYTRVEIQEKRNENGGQRGEVRKGQQINVHSTPNLFPPPPPSSSLPVVYRRCLLPAFRLLAACAIADLLVPVLHLRFLISPPHCGRAKLAPHRSVCYALDVCADLQLYPAKRPKNPQESAYVHTIRVM